MSSTAILDIYLSAEQVEALARGDRVDIPSATREAFTYSGIRLSRDQPKRDRKDITLLIHRDNVQRFANACDVVTRGYTPIGDDAEAMCTLAEYLKEQVAR